MNGWSELDRFLRTDPRDVGCAQATEMLHVYAELVATLLSTAANPQELDDIVARLEKSDLVESASWSVRTNE